MDDVAEKIIAILRKNMRDPNKEITLDTKLTDLEIESLDLAVIVFDIEDTFGIQIPIMPMKKCRISPPSARSSTG